MARLRIVVVSQVPPPVHGSTVITQLLLEVLAQRNDVELIDRRFSRSIDDVGRFAPRKIIQGVGLWYRLMREIVRRRPDVAIVFGTNRVASFLVDLGVFRLLSAFGIPTVNYVHTRGYQSLAERGGWWRRQVGRTLDASQSVVVLGKSLTADVAGAREVVVIPNAVPDSRVVAADARRDAAIFLSNLLPEKGAHDFVTVAAELAPLFPDVEFLLAGADVDGQREKLAARCNTDRISLLGKVDETERESLLARARVLVFPSVYPFEAQPLTILEAAAAGVPTVAYGIGGIPDIVHDGESGLLVEPGDVDALRRAIEKVLGDRVLQRSLAEGAKRLQERNHSIPVYRQSWDDLLNQTAQRPE